MNAPSNCSLCRNFVYDEELEGYTCAIDLDEDEYLRFLQGSNEACPYFNSDDEYKIVRRQM